VYIFKKLYQICICLKIAIMKLVTTLSIITVVKCTYPDLPEHAYITNLTDSSQYSDQSVTIACDQGYRLSTMNYMNGTFSFGGNTMTFSCGYDEYNNNYNWIELSEWSCIGKYH